MNTFPCIVCLTFHISVLNAVFDDSDLPRKLRQIIDYGVYFSLNSTLQCYRKHYQLPVVQKLLQGMSEKHPDLGKVDNPHKNHPFILVEGVHRKTRNIVGHFLARKMGGDVVSNPPHFMLQLSANFTDSTLRKAFFGLGGYIASDEARQVIRTVPAVVTGHWLSQIAFAITKVYDEIPPPEAQIYRSWPADLYMPDIVFFVNTHRKLKGREPEVPDNTFLPRFVNVFRNWRYPPVFEINSTYMYEDIASQMLHIINKEFQGNY